MFQRIRALVRKEYRQIKRDTRTLAVLLFLPMFLLMIFGYAVNFDVHHIKTAVYDHSCSAESREVQRLIGAYQYFDIVRVLDSTDEIDYLIDREKIQAALVFPADFAIKMQNGQTASIQFIIDGVNGNTAETAIGYMNQIVRAYSQQVQVQAATNYGLEFRQLIDIRERVWYNPELKTTNFLLPGLIAFILMITAVVSTALSVVREKEHNTIEQITVSPVRSMELMIGKTIPFMLIALASGLLILAAGWLLFGISIQGSVLTLLVATILFLVCALGQGLIISTFANTQAVAFMMAILSSLIPSLLLSGFIFRIESMPGVLQAVSYLVPARYFLVILRGVILKGTGFSYYYDQILFLIGFAVLMLAISSKKMAKVNS